MHYRLPVCLASLLLSAAAAAVDINNANEMELDALKGIGPALSARVLSERSKGEFKDWRDLLGRVKGLGPSHAASLSAQGLTVAGTSFDAGAAPPSRKQRAPGKP